MSKATTATDVLSGEGEGEVLPAELPGPDSRQAWAQELVDRARSEGVSLTGEDGSLTSMVPEVLQAGLDVEMAEHLGYEPLRVDRTNSGNSRNGSYQKTVKTDVGPVELRMPRDREGTFEPVTVPKHVRRLEGFGGNVLSLYAKGLTTGEIQAHLAEIYDTEISRETISKITDAVLPDMVAWQSRPLDRGTVRNRPRSMRSRCRTFSQHTRCRHDWVCAPAGRMVFVRGGSEFATASRLVAAEQRGVAGWLASPAVRVVRISDVALPVAGLRGGRRRRSRLGGSRHSRR